MNMRKNRLNIDRLRICIVHAYVLIIIHLVYFNLNWSLGNEREILRLMNNIESYFNIDAIQDHENDFLFINTSYDNRLIDSETETGNPGNFVITNRKTLGTLFKILAEHGNKQKFIICDLLFDKPSPEDSILAESIVRIDKIITPSADYNNISKQRKANIFNVNNAPAEYVTFNGIISKINIINPVTRDKTLPVVTYEKLSNKKITYNGLFYHSGSNYIPKSVFPFYYYTRHTIKNKQIDLGTLTTLLSNCDTLAFNTIIKDKILLIGNIDSDVHITNLGSMPGSLVLFNSFLTFYRGYHLIHWTWFVFTFILFVILMNVALNTSINPLPVNKGRFSQSIKGILTLSIITILISFFSSIIFNVHVTVLPVVLYIETVKWFRKFV
jgi:hypothetical protein